VLIISHSTIIQQQISHSTTNILFNDQIVTDNFTVLELKSQYFLLHSTYSNLWQIRFKFHELIKMYKFAADLLGSRFYSNGSVF